MHNAAAKAQIGAGVTFAPFANGMTDSICRSWAPCYVSVHSPNISL